MKTKHTSKIFALLLAILMVIAIVPFSAITAFAAATDTVDSVEFELEGYELGKNITDVKVNAVDDAVNVNVDYGEGFMIFDDKLNFFSDGKFAKNTIYVLGVKFSAKDGSEITIGENDVESVTLNGICATMLSYDDTEKIYTAAFYLPVIDREGTPIDAVSLDLALFGYGNPVNEMRLYKEDPEDVRYEVALVGTYNAEGEKLTGSTALEYGMHKIEIYLMANSEYHFESLTVEDVTLNGVNASSISYTVLSGNYIAILRFDICIHEFDNHCAEEYQHWWECDCGEIYENGYEDHYDNDSDGCCDECYFDMPIFIPPQFPDLTVESVEIYIDREIAPVTGGDVTWDDEIFTLTKINGEDAPDGIFNGFSIYWLFSDTFGYNDNYIDFEEDTFRGGFYYCLDIDVYLFAPYAETVEITLKTPTQTYVADVFSGEDYAYAYFSFDKTEGEDLKKYGDTVVTLDGFEVGARAGDITVSVVGEGIDFIGEYGAGYDLFDIEADDYLGENDVIEAGKLYALELCLLGKEGYCIIDFSQSYENVTLNGFSPGRAYYNKNYEDEDYVSMSFTLPVLGDDLKKVTAPTMSLNGYELGCDISDLLLNFESEGLFVYPEYDEDYWAYEISGNGDATVNYCESFEFVLYMWLNDGYTSDGITKDMFILNGIEPTAIYNKVVRFGDGTIEPCVIACYELPVLHEGEGEWQSDKDNHWKLCECGEEVDKAAHEDTDDNGKCDSCDYLLVDVTPIYDVKLILNNYAVGKKVSDINVIVPAGAKYKVVSFEVCDIMSGNPCAPTDVIAIDKGYIIDVELEAELGYKIIEELNSLMNMCPNVTLNGIMGYRDGWNCFRFFMPDFATSTTPYPKGEIKLNGYQLGAKAEDVTVTMPNGYEICGGMGSGFMFFDAYTEGVITEFGTDFYMVSIVFYPNSDYDSSTFSKDTLTLCGQEAEFVIQTPMNYQVTYYLPLAPAATDVKIEKVEVSLNGYGIGVHTSAVTVTANDNTGIDVLEGCFIEDSIIWTELEGGIEAGKKYLYQISVCANEGYTLYSITPERITLDGKAPVELAWEEGYLIATFELDALGTTPEPGTTPGTDDPTTPDDPDKKEGLGAGAIVAIVIGSVAVAGIGGFAIYWLVIQKKSVENLVVLVKKAFAPKATKDIPEANTEDDSEKSLEDSNE